MTELKFRKKVIEMGGSFGITIPKEIIEYLEIKESDEVVLTAEKGKKGKFIAVFRE